MIEISNEIPFLWRLSPESSDGYCSVALVVPHTSESDIQDLTIETGILSLSSGNSRQSEYTDVKEETRKTKKRKARLQILRIGRNSRNELQVQRSR